MARFLILTITCMLVSCADIRTLSEQFLPRYDALFATYHAGSAADAEQAMLEQLQLIDRAEKARVRGLQFHELRWVAYLRLARAREALGKKVDAAQDLTTAVQHFRASGRTGSSEAELRSQLIALADGLEKEVVPAWRN